MFGAWLFQYFVKNIFLLVGLNGEYSTIYISLLIALYACHIAPDPLARSVSYMYYDCFIIYHPLF